MWSINVNLRLLKTDFVGVVVVVVVVVDLVNVVVVFLLIVTVHFIFSCGQ